MREDRMFLKIISFILIQAFITFDLCWAVNGPIVDRSVDTATLGPSASISSPVLQNIFQETENTDEENLDAFLDGLTAVGPQELEQEEEYSLEITDKAQATGMSPSASSSNGDSQQVGIGGTDTGSILEPPLSPPPPGYRPILPNPEAAFKFTLFWKRDDLQEFMEQNYGITFADALSRKELRLFYEALYSLIQEEQFRDNMRQVMSLVVYRKANAYVGGRQDPYQTINIAFHPDTFVGSVTLYNSFFYNSMLPNKMRPLEARREGLSWGIQALADERLNTEKMTVVYTHNSADAKAYLEKNNMMHTLPTIKWIHDAVMADKDLDRGWPGHKQFVLFCEGPISSDFFRYAIEYSGLKSVLNPTQQVSLYGKVNQVLIEKGVDSRPYAITAEILDEGIRRSNIRMDIMQRDRFLGELNRALDQLKGQQSYWSVRERSFPDGTRGSQFSAYKIGIEKMHSLREEEGRYVGEKRVWQVDEGTEPMPLSELVLYGAALPHEGGSVGHMQRVPVESAENPLLPIDFNWPLWQIIDFMFKLVKGE